MSPLNSVLAELFEAHQVDTLLRGKWIHFPTTPYWACASLGQEIPNPVGLTVQLDVRFAIAPGRFIIESCAGIGENRAEAIEEAFRNFTAYSFHVLLKAFLQPEYDDVLQEEWGIGGHNRTVDIGNVVIRGTLPGEREEVLNWFESMEERIQTLDLGPETHWVHLYYGQTEGRALACEVLLDNEPWPEMQSDLAAFAWPYAESFYSVRLLLIIEGDENREITPEGAVMRLAETLAANPELTQDEAYETLTDADVPDALADRTYKFTQVAWGRILLSHMGLHFSNDYLCFDADGEICESGKLTEEPSFLAASRIGARYVNLPACRQLALASADVHAINNALNAGSQPENLIMAPVCNLLESPTAAGMQKVQQTLAQHIAPLREQIAPLPASPLPQPTAQKNSSKWQFWKR